MSGPFEQLMRSARHEEEDGEFPAKISAAFRVVETLLPYTRGSVSRTIGGETVTQARELDVHERGAHNAALGLLRNWLNGEVELETPQRVHEELGDAASEEPEEEAA